MKYIKLKDQKSFKHKVCLNWNQLSRWEYKQKIKIMDGDGRETNIGHGLPNIFLIIFPTTMI